MTSTSSKKYVLAIDHGTSGMKTALVSTHGEVLDFVYEHTPVYFQDQGGAEQNPNEWWQAILNTSKELLAKEIVPVEDIIAVSSSSQWSGTVAVDEQGNSLMNAIIWMDARGAKYLKEKVFRGLIKISGYPLRDIIRFLYKTGGAPTHINIQKFMRRLTNFLNVLTTSI
ncbi:MAG: FGGY family carbohydrate kinase [Candidatus Hodarchaeales archaeon]|jgi:xylulokinase